MFGFAALFHVIKFSRTFLLDELDLLALQWVLVQSFCCFVQMQGRPLLHSVETCVTYDLGSRKNKQ